MVCGYSKACGKKDKSGLSRKIIIRGDSGFSCTPFYQLADQKELQFILGLSSNEVLKRKLARAEKAVNNLFVFRNEKQQIFMSYT